MPELCARLTSVTGAPHTAAAALLDYPVFVSVKSGDPARVRALVASALHAQWRLQDGTFSLRPVPAKRDEDYPEFARLFRRAVTHPASSAAAPSRFGFLLNFPIHDFYLTPVGDFARYGATPTDYVRPLPDAVVKSGGPPEKDLRIRRLGAGIFELPGGGDIEFAGLPPEVEALLGGDASKSALRKVDLEALELTFRNPDKLKIDWRKTDSRDPGAIIADLTLPFVAASIKADLVVALPDLAIMAALFASEGSGSVGRILGGFSSVVIWSVVDGAVVGHVAGCESSNPSQTRRSVLSKFVTAIGAQGLATISTLSEYVASQRRAASDGWCDVGFLALAGVVIDQEYIGDYPFNVRLYAELSPDDWSLLRSGKSFPASALSLSVQHELLDLLLRSRSRIEDNAQDPALWATLDFSRLMVSVDLSESPVLVNVSSVGGEVKNVAQSGMNYELRKREIGREPLYETATKRLLKLTIASPREGESVESGFSEIIPGKSKPTPWQELPAEIAKEFAEGLELAKRRPPPDTGSPPPPRS